MYAPWHRVAIVRALAARGWRPLAPSLDLPYGVGETHRFARGADVLRLDVVPGRGGWRLLEVVVATPEWTRGGVPGPAAPARLRLERADGGAWRVAVEAWVERVEAAAGG